MKYYCTNKNCGKEVYEIEPANKYKKYGKIIRSQYCYDCDQKSLQKLDKTPHAISVKKIAKWQAGQTKSYSK
jgi:hypothetical protein